MKPTENMPDLDVDKLLMAAKVNTLEPPSDLSARVIADAHRVRVAGSAPAQVRTGFVSGLIGKLGGWPTVSGLAAASCAGFWIGFSPPLEVLDVDILIASDAYIETYEEAAELSGFGWAGAGLEWEEG